MSDDTLRDRILRRLEFHDVSHDAHNTADEILDEVREAMLSDAAVEAATIRLWGMPADAHDMAAKAIEAAMDAALGGDGHE